jgi:hypothetical protein
MQTIRFDDSFGKFRNFITLPFSNASPNTEGKTVDSISNLQASIKYSRFFYYWKLLSLFNLVLVASAGVLLRAKILFPIPWIDHKFLLHAHSHFAFSGWLGQILSVLMIQLISRSVSIDLKKLGVLFILNAIASYGMLFTFPFMGYAGASIFFSTISLVYSIWFALVATRYVNKSSLSGLVKNCFRLGLISLIISTAGPVALATIMMLKIQTMELEVKAVYWFLHFQYNGFFLFSIFGLYCASFSNYWQKGKYLKQAFIMFAVSLVPAYILSIQWLKLSWQMQSLAAIAGVLQLLGLIQAIRYLLLNKVRRSEWIWALAFIAFALKIAFQFISIFPSIGKIAFGFRPIVIGYLHLVLLGFMTTFLLGYIKRMFDSWKKSGHIGIVVFVTGIVLNELVLFFQGLTGIIGIYIHSINEILFAIATILLAGIVLIATGYRMKTAI